MQRSAAQRSSSYAAFKSAAQRMCEHTCMQMQRSAAQHSAAHHVLRLKAACIYSAAQRMCERTFTVLQCTFCAHFFHGTCLSIDDSLISFLHVVNEIGGWSYPSCRVMIQSMETDVPSKTSIPASGRPSAHIKSSAASRIDQVSAELIDIKFKLKIISDHLITSSGVDSNPANNNTSRSKPDVQHSASLVGKSSHDNAVPGPSKQPTANPGLPKIPGPGLNQPRIDPDLRAAMLSALHSEFNSVSQRAMNVVVSGLPIRNNISNLQILLLFQSYNSYYSSIRSRNAW